MPKCVYDTSMDRRFVGESICIKSAQLCARNGRVYTFARDRKFFICLNVGQVCFLKPSTEVFKYLGRGLNEPSIKVLLRPRPRVC